MDTAYMLAIAIGMAQKKQREQFQYREDPLTTREMAAISTRNRRSIKQTVRNLATWLVR